jgi:bacteriocin-like protein
VQTSKAEQNVSKDELSEKELEKVTGGTDIEQTLSIGSQSAGAGAGKVTFNSF